MPPALWRATMTPTPRTLREARAEVGLLLLAALALVLLATCH